MSKVYWKVALSDVDISKKEENAVQNVLRSKWLSMGEMTIKFEEEFGKLHKAKHSIAVSNCSAALHLAILALGIKKGDEVICPSLTFVSTVNSVLHAGARPVFADLCSHNNLTISPEDIEKKISKRTKAVIVVHYAGYPSDMSKIMSIAHKYNLYIVEDCAHAPLTAYRGKYLGTYGDIGCFSFFANKNMTTAEGGLIITGSKGIASKIKSLRSHGMTSLTLDRYKGHSYSYDVIDLGFNYRIDEIRASLGLVQLKRLSGFNSKRRRLVKYYHRELEHIKELETVFNKFKLEESACHIFPVLLKNKEQRNGLQKFLKSSGIQTSIHYPPVHRFSYYKKRLKYIRLPITEDVADRIMTLPLYPGLKKTQIDYIINKITEYFTSIDERYR